VTDRSNAVGRVVVVAAVTLVAVVVGWTLFVETAADVADLLGMLLVGAVALAAARVGSNVAASWFPDYDAAEVAVEGPITRDGGGRSFPPGGVARPTADDVVDAVEAADDDPNADALLVRLNTPGGEVVPSDDIRRAVASFDGPTVAYAVDVCASGGYWIAAGCDELWAHEATLVGSIGVIGSRPNVSELAADLGVSYERFAAGKYKDAGQPLKEPTDDDRAYLQGLVDDFYDDFVERVAEGRDLDPETVRDTEARVYVGSEAESLGLVDGVGSRDDAEAALEERLGRPVSTREFSPKRGVVGRFRGGAERVAYALGAGLAGAFTPEDGFDFRL
jgi:protease-4